MPLDTISLPLPSGYTLPLHWFGTGTTGPVLVFLPALGMATRFYRPLAAAFEARGIGVLMVEQRGHGDSPWRPSRQQDFGFREALTEDIPAALDWLEATHPGRPAVLMGHSLGGHYATMLSALIPERLQGIVICATGTAWHGAFRGKTARQLRLLTRIMPLLLRVLGYYPGEQLGFGGKEAARLMRDWLQLAGHDRYAAEGIDTDLEAGIRLFEGPVLAIQLQDDAYAPATSLDGLLARYRSARVTRRVVDAEALGDAADHFRWARTPEAICETVSDWLSALQTPTASA